MHPMPGLLVQLADPSLKTSPVDAPDAPSSDLYRGELAGTDQRVDLRLADVEKPRHVAQRQESTLSKGRSRPITIRKRHRLIIAPGRGGHHGVIVTSRRVS